MKPSKPTLLLAAGLPLLAGCVQDTASYMIDDNRNHAITVSRAQKWFWSSGVDVAVIAARQPDCLGGLDIKDVARDSELVLHRAPEEYAEPIFILDVEGRHYAISTMSCRVQKFEQPAADPGPVIGSYKVVEDKFQFVAAGQ